MKISMVGGVALGLASHWGLAINPVYCQQIQIQIAAPQAVPAPPAAEIQIGQAIALRPRPISGKMMPTVPTQNKVLQSQVIVIGKIQNLEKELVQAKPFPGSAEKVAFQVATIKIEKALLGAKDETHIRVAWQSNPNAGNAVAPAIVAPPLRGGGPQLAVMPHIRRPGADQIAFSKDQEGCFFLRKHDDGDFYYSSIFITPLDKNAPNYKTEIEETQKILTILKNPKKALTSKEKSEQFQAASVLLSKYRLYPMMVPQGKKIVQKPIDAEISKSILNVLTEMDWNSTDPSKPCLINLFGLLRLNSQDGWQDPKFTTPDEYEKAVSTSVKKWLAENKDNFLIKRWVIE